MTACRVTCGDCAGDGPPAKGAGLWRWLCVDCAEDFVSRHRRESGHAALHLSVTETSSSDLRRRVVSANAVLRRFPQFG